jgi:hypothetical protein
MSNSWVHLFLLVAMTESTDTVQLRNKNLLMTRPAGYRTDFRQKTTDTLTSEMVRMDQSADNWTGNGKGSNFSCAESDARTI